MLQLVVLIFTYNVTFKRCMYDNEYCSIIKWKIDDDGLIEKQIQQWSIPASQALRETFTPSF